MNCTHDVSRKNVGEHRALIVGGSGGIGAALSRALVSKGADVTNLSRSSDGFDISDPEKVKLHMDHLSGTFQTVIVASGILAPVGKRPEKSLNEIDADHMMRVLAVNAIGPALILRHLPRLLPLSDRSVVGVITARVGSVGDNYLGGWYSYRASKAAANQIVHTAAIEISRKRKNAIVVALHPGTVETPFTAHFPGHSKTAPTEAAANLLSVLEGLNSSSTGSFVDWAGKTVPW
ncbi:SDR family NAD(P)-dependent oxidoreductase [Pseudophaeobacter sp.]|uniref:SDR family NAD(P)-dependent oxidoreductase n=1 Tax=Pseudophaeobacter sp. TaxID=1971739 RepID=UPI003299D691